MTLLPHWRRVLRRAWSIRFIFLAALLSGLEVVFALPGAQEWIGLPPGIFAALSFIALQLHSWPVSSSKME